MNFPVVEQFVLFVFSHGIMEQCSIKFLKDSQNTIVAIQFGQATSLSGSVGGSEPIRPVGVLGGGAFWRVTRPIYHSDATVAHL